MKKKPVILQVLPALISGGVERGVVDIAQAIKEAGFTSLVASAGGAMVSQLNAANITHIPLPLATKNPVGMIWNRQRLMRLIRECQVDIVHARSRAPAWSSYWAAQKTGVHFVTTWHGTYSLGGKYKQHYNSIMGRGERVIAVSEFIKKHILEHYQVDAARIRVIPRGVDVEAFSSAGVTHERIAQIGRKLRIEHDCPLILLPGRLTEWKGHLFLLDALRTMTDVPFLCLLVGKADKKHESYRKRIEEAIFHYGLSQRVRLIDHVSDMPSLYYLADVVVSASLRPEAFGRVIPEAQAMGKLVMGTAHGGACETIIHEKTGFLVEPGNVEQCASVLRRMLALSAMGRTKVTDAAQMHVREHFSLRKMQESTLEVYRETL